MDNLIQQASTRWQRKKIYIYTWHWLKRKNEDEVGGEKQKERQRKDWKDNKERKRGNVTSHVPEED